MIGRAQPTAPTCVVWSWRLIDCFALTSAVRYFLRRGFSLFMNPTALPYCWTPIRVKQLSATDWYCQRDIAVRMREVLARPCVGVCVPLALSLHYCQCNRILFLFTLFFVNYCISWHFQNARIDKIFAHWHLAIAITSYYYVLVKFSCFPRGVIEEKLLQGQYFPCYHHHHRY